MKKNLILSLFVFFVGSVFAQNVIQFDILTDNYPQETSWTIVNTATSATVASSPGYTNQATQYPTQDIDLPDGNYLFTIFDSAGDGICCGYGIGNYSLTDVSTGLTIVSGGEFGNEESMSFVLPYVPPVAGCTNPNAYNFNSEAEVDDGSCLFLQSELTIDLQEVASGLNSVVDIASAGDDRLFLVQQGGQIKILHPATGIVEATNFLNISSSITSGGEQGLLGLAFHPDYANNGYFFVNYTKPNGDSRIARFTVSDDPNVADPTSETIILEQDQPFGNHNAGDLNFGPDGYLYIPFGDGGSGGDPFNNAQSGDTWLGKMLRIDINGTDQGNYSIPPDNPFVGNNEFLDEIWDYGLRNTWRFSFDSETGEMWLGDVGQNAIEEVDVEPAGEGGKNYGWRCYEGTDTYDTSLCDDVDITDVTMPVFQYNHSNGACAVTGGYVYRGTEFPAMVGKYFFVDYCNGVFYSLEPDGEGGYLERNFGNNFGSYWPTFGEANDGSIYASGSFGNTIYKLVDPCSDFQPTLTIDEEGDLLASEGTDFVWLINGEVMPDSTNQTLTNVDFGSNTYQASVNNADGCAQLTNIVNLVSVDQLQFNDSFRLFPNPAKNTLFVNQSYFTSNYLVTIVDGSGKKVLEVADKKQLDISNLSSGNYMLILSQGKEKYQQSFLKK